MLKQNLINNLKKTKDETFDKYFWIKFWKVVKISTQIVEEAIVAIGVAVLGYVAKAVGTAVEGAIIGTVAGAEGVAVAAAAATAAGITEAAAIGAAEAIATSGILLSTNAAGWTLLITLFAEAVTGLVLIIDGDDAKDGMKNDWRSNKMTLQIKEFLPENSFIEYKFKVNHEE